MCETYAIDCNTFPPQLVPRRDARVTHDNKFMQFLIMGLKKYSPLHFVSFLSSPICHPASLMMTIIAFAASPCTYLFTSPLSFNGHGKFSKTDVVQDNMLKSRLSSLEGSTLIFTTGMVRQLGGARSSPTNLAAPRPHPFSHSSYLLHQV